MNDADDGLSNAAEARSQPSDTALASRADALRAWFAQHARSFPWRRDRSPYRVWISEAMLQQTRAATVVPYYLRWMERFPDVGALARASEHDVLALWEGLGYYRRARALYAAARVVHHDRGGRWPESETGWRALPGVGPYTAAAVCSLAYGQPVVAVDGNVRRVGARLFAEPRPDDATLRRRLRALIPDDGPSTTSEALIELGATLCTPRAPRCDACPLAPACSARAQGAQEAYPERRRRTPPPVRLRWALVAIDAGRIWLERRPPDGLLGGLWGFPQVEDRPRGDELDALEQVYSHFRLHLTPVVVPAAPQASADDGGWFDPGSAHALPLSRVDRRLLERLTTAGLLASQP